MAFEGNNKIAGKASFKTAETKVKGGNPDQTWEAKLASGVENPCTETTVALAARNGRNGSQAGV